MKSRVFDRPFLALGASCCALLACNLLSVPAATETPEVPSLTVATQAVPLIIPSETTAPTVAAAATLTPTPTSTPTPESTSTPTGPLAGTVMQKANCRYGPGASYLYKIGMLVDAPIQVVGRTVDGDWANIQFKGTKNLCWIRSSLIQVSGDLMSLPDAYRDSSSLPRATSYGPVAVTSVSGSGGFVTAEWTPIELPDYAMVSEIETEYVVEVWTCRNGKPGFYSLGTNETSMTFDVDSSCGQLSHADIVAQNKAGVSGVTEIALP